MRVIIKRLHAKALHLQLKGFFHPEEIPVVHEMFVLINIKMPTIVGILTFMSKKIAF